MRNRRRPQQKLVAGAVGINTRQEFADKLRAVLNIANTGLDKLRGAAQQTELDEIDEWSGLSIDNINGEAEKLRATVQRLWSRAWRHYIAVKEEAQRAPNDPPDVWCARKGKAALLLNNGIVTCLESAPLGIGRELSKELRQKLDEGGEEAELTAAAAMLLDASIDGVLE